MALALALTALVRIVITTLLVAVAPLALACHALPHIEGAARLWWRALAAVLGVLEVRHLGELVPKTRTSSRFAL
jgi:hypothetical protein